MNFFWLYFWLTVETLYLCLIAEHSEREKEREREGVVTPAAEGKSLKIWTDISKTLKKGKRFCVSGSLCCRYTTINAVGTLCPCEDTLRVLNELKRIMGFKKMCFAARIMIGPL